MTILEASLAWLIVTAPYWIMIAAAVFFGGLAINRK